MATIALALENSKDKTAKVRLAFVMSSVIWIKSVSFAFFLAIFGSVQVIIERNRTFCVIIDLEKKACLLLEAFLRQK